MTKATAKPSARPNSGLAGGLRSSYAMWGVAALAVALASLGAILAAGVGGGGFSAPTADLVVQAPERNAEAEESKAEERTRRARAPSPALNTAPAATGGDPTNTATRSARRRPRPRPAPRVDSPGNSHGNGQGNAHGNGNGNAKGRANGNGNNGKR